MWAAFSNCIFVTAISNSNSNAYNGYLVVSRYMILGVISQKIYVINYYKHSHQLRGATFYPLVGQQFLASSHE